MVRQASKNSNKTKAEKAKIIKLSDGQKQYLSRSRRRSHDKADENAFTPNKIVDHPLVCADETELVSTQDELEVLLKKLRKNRSFAFDTEFIGEQTYYPKLCLIQVATESFVAVIDPLAELDLSGFWQLITDENICKIVHAGAQDLEPAWRLESKEPANVFDTQIAAGFAAMPYPLNLRELVYRLTGAKLKKASGFTQWDRRPLTAAQLSYAADDVRYLPAVKAVLENILGSNGNISYAQQQNIASCSKENWVFDPTAAALKMRGAKDLTAKQLAVLAEILNCRENLARASNIPARMALSDDNVRKLSRKYKNIKTLDDLNNIASVPQRVISAVGPELLKALKVSTNTDLNQFNRPKPSSESALRRQLIDSIWVLIQAWALAKEIAPALVSSRQELAEFFAFKCPKSDKKIDIHLLAESELNTGWRGEIISGLIDKAASKEGINIGFDAGLKIY